MTYSYGTDAEMFTAVLAELRCTLRTKDSEIAELVDERDELVELLLDDRDALRAECHQLHTTLDTLRAELAAATQTIAELRSEN